MEIDNVEAARTVRVVVDATQVDPMVVVPVISASLVIWLIIFWMIGGNGRSKTRIPYDNPLSVLPEQKEGG